MKNKIYIVVLLFIFLPLISLTASQPHVALLNSVYSENYQGKNWTVDHLTFWELFLMNNKIDYDVINDNDLESGISTGDYKTIIVAYSPYLSDEEIISLQNFMNEGGSVLSIWKTGFYDGKGSARNITALQKLFNLSNLKEPEPDYENSNVYLEGDTPFSINIQTGTNIFVSNKYQIFTKLENVSNSCLGYIFNSDNTISTSSVYGNNGLGNFVWLGFDIPQIYSGKEQKDVLTKLLINSLNWLNGDAVFYSSTWPNDKNAAVVVSVDYKKNSQNINCLIESLNNKNIKPEIFVDPITTDSSNLNELSKVGEIGISLSDNYEWKNINSRKDFLIQLKNKIYYETQQKMIPVKLSAANTDDANLNSLSLTGMNIVNSEKSQNYLPEIYNKKILIVSNNGKNDYGFAKENKINSYAELAGKYLHDYRRIYLLGGFYNLNYSDALPCVNNCYKFIDNCFDEFNKNEVWITNLSDIYNWMLEKNSVFVSKEKESTGEITLKINNKNSEKVNDLVINIIKNNLPEKPSITVKDNNKNVDFSFNPEKKVMKIFIKKINPFEIKLLKIQFNDFL